MAHVAKYKASGAPSMMRHYRRDRVGTMKRDNIDPERTKDNYTLGWVVHDDGSLAVGSERVRVREDAKCCVSGTERVQSGGWDEVRARIAHVEAASGRKVRKDAVVLADMVITAPADVPPKDMRKFFAYSYMYLSKQVGRENMLGGYVHMDEKTPHMHCPFTPITTNDKGKPTFSYKRLCPRSFYQSFHSGLGDYLEKRLGYRPSVELTEEQREERMYVENTEDIDAARATVAARVTAPAREEKELAEQEAEEARGDLAEVNGKLDAARTALAAAEKAKAEAEKEARASRSLAAAEAERLEGLQRVNEEIAPIAGELESAAAEARGWGDAGRAGKREILGRVGGGCGKVAALLRGLAGDAGEGATPFALAVGRCHSAISEIGEALSERARAARERLAARHPETFSEKLDRLRGVSARDPSRGGRGYSPPSRSR